MAPAVHLNLDDAWPADQLPMPSHDLPEWGPKLRYCTSARAVDRFYEEVRERLAKVIVYGSGDFHHLSGLWVRRFTNPLVIVCFDNHPDWDIRPPRWSCGAWVNRALELPQVHRVAVWGCGNFELEWPARMFANRAALRDGRLEVFAWEERQSQAVRRRFECISQTNWRERFTDFSRGLHGKDVYITVDLDCIRADQSVTNWEQGLFTAGDVTWAINELRCDGRIVGGDICGAWSPQVYARPLQRFAGWMDHPKVTTPDLASAQSVNLTALRTILPTLTGSS